MGEKVGFLRLSIEQQGGQEVRCPIIRRRMGLGHNKIFDLELNKLGKKLRCRTYFTASTIYESAYKCEPEPVLHPAILINVFSHCFLRSEINLITRLVVL